MSELSLLKTAITVYNRKHNKTKRAAKSGPFFARMGTCSHELSVRYHSGDRSVTAPIDAHCQMKRKPNDPCTPVKTKKSFVKLDATALPAQKTTASTTDACYAS